ncbi:hypothetical protein [Syntrophobotulus glycolicus]|nr:hypothetical protein [Syntrophobotulus glycolicus]
MSDFQRDVLHILQNVSDTWIVGGAVRDQILGLAARDLDLVTMLDPVSVRSVLEKHRYKVHHIGIPFGTLTVFQDEQRIDIIHTDDLETDAQRRDFTINCIYQNSKTGEIFDPFQGREDLEKRQIKTCGRAEDRFTEDPVRILRMIRFAHRQAFTIEENTWKSARASLALLEKAAPERTTGELVQILLADRVVDGVRLLDELGYWDRFIPELTRLKGLVQNQYHSLDVWEHTMAVLQALPSDLLMRLAGLFHDLGKWGTASRECTLRGVLRKGAAGFFVDQFKIIGTRGDKEPGRQLKHLVGQGITILGARLDNDQDTVQLKKVLSEEEDLPRGLQLLPNGKRHFLNHESESALILKKILKRYHFAMYFPGAGQKREEELLFIVASHLKGTLTFRPELRKIKSRLSFQTRAASLVWEICWDNRQFHLQLIQNFLLLWKADYYAGKTHTGEEEETFEEIIRQITQIALWQAENIDKIDWQIFYPFIQNKQLTGRRIGEFKNIVLREMMVEKRSILQEPFLQQLYAKYANKFI